MTDDSGSHERQQPSGATLARGRAGQPANNAHDVRGTEGLFTHSMCGHSLQLLLPPQATTGKPSSVLEFPSDALVVSQTRATQSWLSSDLGLSQPSVKKPRAKGQLVAAGHFLQQSASWCLGCPRSYRSPWCEPGQSESSSCSRLCSPQCCLWRPQGPSPGHTLHDHLLSLPACANAGRTPAPRLPCACAVAASSLPGARSGAPA